MLKALLDVMETSPKCIIPQKAHSTIAQMQASKGSSMLRDACRAHSMLMVMGGWMGHLRLPCKFSRPHKDQLMWLWSSSESRGGQPWAMCQARTAARYFLTTVTETGSNGMFLGRFGSSMWDQLRPIWQRNEEDERKQGGTLTLELRKYHKKHGTCVNQNCNWMCLGGRLETPGPQ